MTSTWTLGLLVSSLLQTVFYVRCQPSASVPACCALKLMDTNQQVAIETERSLTAGVYRAVSLRVCTTDTVYIQVWTRINSRTMQLKWQTSITPITTQTYQTYVTVRFNANNQLTVTSADRLGIFGASVSTEASKLAVPYDVNEVTGSVQYSLRRFNNSNALVPGVQVTVADLRYPRSFANFVKFCANADCSDVTLAEPLTSTTIRPTISGDLPFCGCPTSCSADATLKESINNQQSQVNQLEQQIQQMRDVINGLTTMNVPTGYCPTDSQPGVYGVGSCYIVYRRYVQLGEAAIRCSLDHGANLLDIESEIEEQFIYSLVSNITTGTTGRETFWTAGMYSPTFRQWWWYKQDWTPREAITANHYRDWQNNFEPTPSSDIDTCLVVTVDSEQSSIYWRKELCISPNYYICEIPKLCY